jgi:nitroreductase
VSDTKLLDDINAAIKAKMPDIDNIFYHAPFCIFISGDNANKWSEVDAGIAVQNIAIAAQGLGLGSVILGMPKYGLTGEGSEEFCKKLKFPEGYSFKVGIAVGIPAQSPAAHEIHAGKVDYID